MFYSSANVKRFGFYNLLITAFLAIISANSFAQSGSSVSGKLTGFSLHEKAAVIINNYNGYEYAVYDTTSLNSKGEFGFQKKLSDGFYQLSIPSQGIVRPFYENGIGELKINFFNKEFDAEKVQFSDTENQALTELLAASKHLEITLNTLNEEFDPRQLDSLYFKKIAPHNLKIQEAYREFNKKTELLKVKYPETVVMNLFSKFYQIPLFDEDKIHGKYYDNQDAYMRDHFFDLWKLDDKRVIRLPEIKSKIDKYFRFFAKKNDAFLMKKCDEIIGLTKNQEVKNYLSTVLIDFFSKVKEEDIVSHIVETQLHGCTDNLDLSLIQFNQNNQRGSKVSVIDLPSASGQPISLASVYNQAKLTILYFWTPDCIHCRNLHPVVKSLKIKYTNQIAVYSVGLEDDKQKWTATVNEFALNFNNVNAAGEERKKVKQLFNIKYTPMIYLLNSSGEIVEKDIYAEDLDKAVSRFLNSIK